MKVIKIPTLNDNPSDYDALFQILRSLNQGVMSVRLDFTHCVFLRQSAVAFLGGLIRLIESRGGKSHIAQETLEPQVKANLMKNNFLSTLLGEREFGAQGNTIPFREDHEWENTKMVDYLKYKWLGRGWLHISDNLRDAIIGKVAEIYLNSFEHSNSSIGVFSCGQYYPKLNKLYLTVVDFGAGIPANVRNYFGRQSIKSSKALEWSFKSGTTTSPEGFGRGLGLDLLKSFVKKNKGCLEVYSLDGFVRINREIEVYQDWNSFFQGTLINIELQCDEKYYVLAGESEPNFSN